MDEDKQELTDKFFAMIRKLNRSVNDILEVRKFFGEVSEVRHIVPPTVEYMTILKAYRPRLFHEFKSSLIPNSRMRMLANISFDLGEAIANLGITDEEQLYRAMKGKSKPQ